MARREGKASLDGHLHPDFQDVAEALKRQLEGYTGGAAVCVYHRGECVVDLWGGEKNEAGDPWTRETMSPSFSTTKGVASTLVHIMADRGLIDYDARVAEYWPEFAQAGKAKITVRQVLAHQSGLYHIRQMIDDATRMLDWEYMVGAIERTKPIHPPGARTGYHGLTYGYLVGEILQRVTGESFPRLVRKELAEPLGLDGFYIGAPEEVLNDAATLMWPKAADTFKQLPFGSMPQWLSDATHSASSMVTNGLERVGVSLDLVSIMDALAPRGISTFDFSANDTLRAPIPAGNGLFTARSLARMYAALAAGGEIDGVRILSTRAVDRAGMLQNEAPGRAVLPFDMRWRLGYHGVVTSYGVPGNALGHFGFGGSGAWADRELDLSVAMIVNSGMGTPFGDLRIVRMGGAALASARRRSGETVYPVQRAIESWSGSMFSCMRRREPRAAAQASSA